MALTEDEQKTLQRLATRHDGELPELEQLDQVYEGCEPLEYMHPEIKAELGDRIRPVRVFWAQTAVDSIAERLALQNFNSGNKELDKELGRVWAANDMDLGLSQAIVDALVMRRSYISVGTNEEDDQTPLVRPESPLEVYVDVDPRTRMPRAALRRYADVDPMGGVTSRYATLYLPDVTVWCEYRGEWKEVARDEHGMGAVAIACLVNRPRTRSSTRSPRTGARERIGRSDVETVRDLQQAGTKSMTDMMVAGELVAVPLRGITDTSPGDFLDQDGNPMSPLRAMLGRLLTIPSDQARALDFAAAQLENFATAEKTLSQITSSVTGLPAHHMGTPSDNPASAEAITASESRLATRAEKKQVSFGVGVRRVAQLIYRLQNGEWSEELRSCEIRWRDVRTPTRGAAADAAQKLFASGLVPKRQTRVDLGYDEDQIADMELEDAAVAAQSPGTQLANALTNNLGGAGNGGTAGGPAGG